MATAHQLVPLHICGNTTEEQDLLLHRYIEEATGSACKIAIEQLDRQGAQFVLDTSTKLQTDVSTAILEIIQRHASSDKYREEQAGSDRVYPPNYRVRPVEAQVTEIRKLFPGLGACREKLARLLLPEGAEAWFAIPRWQALAGAYEQAMEILLGSIASRRRFANRLLGKMSETFLRQSERARLAESILADQQPGCDILVVAVQAGMLHRGASARRTRVTMAGNEFGLGAFAIGSILLTHPERLSSTETLMMDCCGDEYSLHGDSIFDRVPLFDYDIGGVEFSVFYEDRARNLWGSPTGFLCKLV